MNDWDHYAWSWTYFIHSDYMELYRAYIYNSKFENESDVYMINNFIEESNYDYNYSMLLEEFSIDYDTRYQRFAKYKYHFGGV